jgi:predicted DNA-binding protein YlxM (UPF0122 family)
VEFIENVLPEKQFAVVFRHYIEGKSKKEISKELGICPRCVLYLKKEARKRLRDALSANHYSCLRKNRIRQINKKIKENQEVQREAGSYEG